jgi:LemA protein
MDIGVIVLGVAVAIAGAILVGWAIGVYNSLVDVRAHVHKAWSNIDVLLQQRHDELPKLIDTCKGHVTHEREVLERVTRLRAGYDGARTVDAKARAENELNRQLDRLSVVLEAYPGLQASQHFQQVQGRITALESAIADRRELFNDSVTIHNVRIARFPEILVAGALRYRPHALLEVPDEKKRDVKVDFA